MVYMLLQDSIFFIMYIYLYKLLCNQGNQSPLTIPMISQLLIKNVISECNKKNLYSGMMHV
jgi:hypothetical protein